MTAYSEVCHPSGSGRYAFADVNAVPVTSKTVRSGEPLCRAGQRAYLRRVNFSANVSTRDNVFGQEMNLRWKVYCVTDDRITPQLT